MYCNRLCSWWSTQSRLAALLSTLTARRWVGLQILQRFQLNDLSTHEMVGAKMTRGRNDSCPKMTHGRNDPKLGLPGVSTQLQSSGLVAHENSTFRNLALAVSGPCLA